MSGTQRERAEAHLYDIATHIEDEDSSELESFFTNLAKKEPARADLLRENHKLVRHLVVRFRDQRERTAGDIETACRTFETASRDDDAVLAQAEEDINYYQQVNAARFSRLGISYDPANPSDKLLLWVQPLTPEQAAEKLKLPYSGETKSVISQATNWFITTLVGATVGLSAGVFWGFIIPENVHKSPVTIIVFILVGIAVILGAKHAIQLTEARAERLRWAQRPSRQWISAKLVSWGIVLFVILGDAFTQYHGFTRRIDAQSAAINALGASSQAPQAAPVFHWSIFLVSLIFVFGYAMLNKYIGEREGRESECLNRIHAFIEEDRRKRVGEWRENEKVQEALQGLNRLQIARLRHKTASDNQKVAEKVRNDAIAQSKQLVADRYDELIAAQRQFDDTVKKAREECDGFAPSTAMGTNK